MTKKLSKLPSRQRVNASITIAEDNNFNIYPANVWQPKMSAFYICCIY